MSCPIACRTAMVALCIAAIVSSAPRAWGQQEPVSAAAEVRDVLAAEADGAADVRFVANDARSAQVVVTNRGDRPLTLRLPAAFAGVPVLAQMGQQGAGFGAGGIGGIPQNVGGGGVQNQGMGIGGPQGGNPFCWVAREVYGVHDPRWLAFRQWMVWEAPAWLQELYRERGEGFAGWIHERPAAKAAVRVAMDQVIAADGGATGAGVFRVAPTAADAFTKPFTVAVGATVAVKVPTVCLEYGKREPTARMPYRLTAFEKVSQDPKVALILGGLASGHLSQKVAQAAAWHLASGRTWEQLAAEVIDRAGGDPDVPVFSAAELAAARQAVDVASRLAVATHKPGDSSAAAE
ncbi:MAG: hypothetical protein ACKO1M_14215 [Planctomycetota bacterium]